MNRTLEKYLKTRATISPWVVAGTGRSDFSAAIIIPALAEQDNLPLTLDRLSLNSVECLAQTLIIVVVNNRVDVSTVEFVDNQNTLRWLQSTPYPQLNLVWMDASSNGLEIPDRDGVGLARKIGFDAALQLVDWNVDPLLISLDGDTLVDHNYLSTVFDHFSAGENRSAVIPFHHQFSPFPEQEAAIRHYELYLRSYLFGLTLAGSPYTFHSIGSAFACRADAYIKAGGMNRRCGGEDFYFLQQLAKTSVVKSLVGTVVHPSSRFSQRVPFGTGKAVQEQVEKGIVPFHFVPVGGFKILKEWLKLINLQVNSSADQIHRHTLDISPVLYQFLTELNFVHVWEKLQKNHSAKKQRLAAFHHWFDALRTRQLLTRIEDEGSSAEKVVAELLNWGGFGWIEDRAEQLRLLESLQGVKGHSPDSSGTQGIQD